MIDSLLLAAAPTAPPKGDARPPTPSAAEARSTSFKKALDAAAAPPQPKAEARPPAEAKAQSDAKAEAETQAETETEAAAQPVAEDPALRADNPATLAAMALLLAQLTSAPAALPTRAAAQADQADQTVSALALDTAPAAQLDLPAGDQAEAAASADALPSSEMAALLQQATARADTDALSPSEMAALLQQATARADTARLSPEALRGPTQTPASTDAASGQEVKPATAAAAKNTETVFQNLMGGVVAAPGTPKLEMARLAETQAPVAALAPEIVLPQIVRGVEGLARAGATSMHLQLHPEALGRIDVQLTASADGMRVTLTADRLSTSTLLQQNLPDLRHTLAETGLTISGLSVGVGQGQNGQAFGWQQTPNPAGLPTAFRAGEADPEAAEPTVSLTAAGAGTRVNYWI